MSVRVAGMQCPVCSVPLTMSERQNVEIDYCPECRGVWLDRGEIDKIVERSFEQRPPRRELEERPQGGPGRCNRNPYEDRRRYEHAGYKRRSWLSDIFD